METCLKKAAKIFKNKATIFIAKQERLARLRTEAEKEQAEEEERLRKEEEERRRAEEEEEKRRLEDENKRKNSTFYKLKNKFNKFFKQVMEEEK